MEKQASTARKNIRVSAQLSRALRVKPGECTHRRLNAGGGGDAQNEEKARPRKEARAGEKQYKAARAEKGARRDKKINLSKNFQPGACTHRRLDAPPDKPDAAEIDQFEQDAFGPRPAQEGARAPQSRRARRRKNVWWATPVAMAMAAVLALLMIFVGSSIYGYARFLNMKGAVERDTFYPGVYLDGQDLSAMTLDEAMDKWGAGAEAARESFAITLTLDDQSWSLDADELGYKNDYQEMISLAWSVGRYGTLEERYAVVTGMDGQWSRSFETTSGIDEERALTVLGAIADELSSDVVNAQVASFDTQSGEFTFTESRAGARVDAQALLEDVKSAAAEGRKSVAITRETIYPTDTAGSLSEIYGKIASATTNASSSNSNRLTNLKVACKALNGLCIEPGETFSFNGTLGKRTAKKGYKAAAAYENGVTTNQLGGGICQVSSTLFNAVAKADLKIVERAPHSRPSSYVDLGKDAVVNWPNQDFKFKNDTDYPVYLTATVTSNKRVVIAVYGKKLEGGITIKIVSQKTSESNPGADRVTYDDSLLPGERVVVEQARKGYTATTYRVYYDANGTQIKKEVLCKSSYAAAGAVVRVGPS